MSLDLVLEPRIKEAQRDELEKWACTLDQRLDEPTASGKPIGDSGFLERLGTILWQNLGLDEKQLLERIEEARDVGEPFRLRPSAPRSDE